MVDNKIPCNFARGAKIKKMIPNILSITRIALAGIVWLAPFHNVIIVSIIWGALSDFADGYLARKWSVSTQLGALLDPIGDKCLITSLVIWMGWHGMLPLWWVGVTLVRDVLILLGGCIALWLFKKTNMPPTFVSKVNTGLQLLVFIMAVWPLPYISLMIVLATTTTIVSGVEYARVFSRMVKERPIL